MKDTARSRSRGQESTAQVAFAAMLDVRATLHDAIGVSAGMGVLGAMLEEERARLCGPRYEHQPGRRATRSGHADGEFLAVGGRRMRVRRPRVRSVDGEEVTLETWERFSCGGPCSRLALSSRWRWAISTRKYIRSIEPAPPGFKTRGTSKSAVSRRFVAATGEKLAEMMSRDLRSDRAVRHHDRRHSCRRTILVLVALGIDDKSASNIRLATLRRRHGELDRFAAACSPISKPAACAPTARCSSSSTAARRSRRRFARSSERVRLHPTMPGPQEAQYRGPSAGRNEAQRRAHDLRGLPGAETRRAPGACSRLARQLERKASFRSRFSFTRGSRRDAHRVMRFGLPDGLATHVVDHEPDRVPQRPHSQDLPTTLREVGRRRDEFFAGSQSHSSKRRRPSASSTGHAGNAEARPPRSVLTTRSSVPPPLTRR